MARIVILPRDRVRLLGHVGLVADEHLLHDLVLARVLLDVVHPERDVVEGARVGHVVDQDDAGGAAVVGPDHGAEPLLARSVPNLIMMMGTWLRVFCRETYFLDIYRVTT